MNKKINYSIFYGRVVGERGAKHYVREKRNLTNLYSLKHKF